VEESRRRLVSDPATSGGLLIALAPERAGEVDGTLIGWVEEGETGAIRLL
jgi:selenophosphate synthase